MAENNRPVDREQEELDKIRKLKAKYRQKMNDIDIDHPAKDKEDLTVFEK